MPFLRQTPEEGKNNCGAFCVCYLRWLKAGRTPEKGVLLPDDSTMVNDVYKQVIVGNAAIPKLLPDDYCDPVKMIKLLQKENKDAAFYYSGESMVTDILKAMRQPGAPEKDDIDELDKNNKLINIAPNPPLAGQSAIAVYYVSAGKGLPPFGMHYILYRTNPEGQHFCYNPWFGTAEHFTDKYIDFDCGWYLSPANAAIIITEGSKA